MKSKHFNRIFYTFIVLGIIVGGSLYVYKDHNTYVTDRRCVESSGPSHVNPIYGDGPECGKYALVTERKAPQQSFFWGGLAGAFVGGWIGVLAATATDSVIKRHKKTS